MILDFWLIEHNEVIELDHRDNAEDIDMAEYVIE